MLFLFALCAFASGLSSATAQSLPTATRRLTPSIFAGATGVRTGLDSGRNLSITAGIDLSFLPRNRLHPAFEYRGTYAIDKGGVDSLKNNLAGVKLYRRFGRLGPYLDLLAGRGETTYANGGYQVPNRPVFYTQSASNVFSFGGGVDFRATEHLALKVDLQGQRYSSPVTTSGHVYAEAGTIGLVYSLHLGHKAH